MAPGGGRFASTSDPFEPLVVPTRTRPGGAVGRPDVGQDEARPMSPSEPGVQVGTDRHGTRPPKTRNRVRPRRSPGPTLPVHDPAGPPDPSG